MTCQQDDGDASHVPREDRLAQKFSEESQSQHSGKQGVGADEKCQDTRECDVARGVAQGKWRKCRCGENGRRGFRPDREQMRRTQQCIDGSRDDDDPQARLGWHSGDGRVGQYLGYQVRGHGYRTDQIST